MDASSKSGESTDSPPSRSDSHPDSQKSSQQERPLSQTSSSLTSSTPAGPGSLVGSSNSSAGRTPVRTPTPPKRNQSPQSSLSQDAVTNSSGPICSSRPLTGISSPVSETKVESPPSTTPNFKDPESNPTVTLVSGKVTPTPVVTTAALTVGNSSSTITLSSSIAGMKRPPSDSIPTSVSQNTPAVPDNPDSDSSGDPKRKKMRKEQKTESADSPAASGSSNPGTNTASTSSNSARGARTTIGSKQGKPSVSSSLSSTSAVKGSEKPSASTGSVGSPASSGGSLTPGTGPDATSIKPDGSSSSTTSTTTGISTSWEGPSQPMDTSESSSNSTEESAAVFVGSRVKQTETGSSTSILPGSSSGSSGNAGNGCPKVPPIKIVLQAHAHGNLNAGHCVGSSGNTGGNSSESDNTSISQHAASSGFPYVVSSTTDNSSSTNVNPVTSTALPGVSSVPTASSNSGSSSPVEASPLSNSNQTAGQFPSGSITNPPTTNVSMSTSSTSSAPAPQDITSTEQPSATTVPTSTSQSETNVGSNAPTYSIASVSSSTLSTAATGMTTSVSYASSTLSGTPVTSAALTTQSVSEKSTPIGPAVATTSSSINSIVLGVSDRDKDKPSTISKDSLSNVSACHLLSVKDDRMKESIGLKGSTCYGSLGPSSLLPSGGLLSVSGGSNSSTGSFQDDKEKEKPQRVTRSSHRMAHHNVGGGGNAGGSSNSASSSSGGTPSSPSGPGNGNSPKNSNCPSPTQQDIANQPPPDTSFHAKQQEIQEKLEAAENANVDVHPRKRKIKVKEVTPANSSSSSTSGEINDAVQSQSSNQAHEQPILNCFEMYLNIRKQIERRRKNLFPVTPKPPQGFKDYLMNRGTYVLASNDKSRVAIPLLNAPTNLSAQMKEMFIEQEKERHKLRIQHLVEKEKLVLSVEQEILRVHGRAARALSNQALPFSVCTILKDQEVYNLLTPEQEEKDRNARSRYNGRLFLSWLQDVDDKWDRIKESMLLRHHNEAESLHAVQKMDWEWKLKEVGLCEPKAAPSIDDIQVPMVHVSDDFDLLPA